MDSFWHWMRHNDLSSFGMACPHTGNRSNHSRYYMLHKIIGGAFMKVVVLTPPKFAAPIIRMIFKIKKINS